MASSSSLKRAKTEKAKLQLIKREGELLKQKTETDVNLNIVRQEQKIANVEAEADSSEDELSEAVNLPTETVNGEQFTITDFSNLLLGKDFLLIPFPNFAGRPMVDRRPLAHGVLLYEALFRNLESAL